MSNELRVYEGITGGCLILADEDQDKQSKVISSLFTFEPLRKNDKVDREYIAKHLREVKATSDFEKRCRFIKLLEKL